MEEKLVSVEVGPVAACHNCAGTCHWSMMRKLRHPTVEENPLELRITVLARLALQKIRLCLLI